MSWRGKSDGSPGDAAGPDDGPAHCGGRSGEGGDGGEVWDCRDWLEEEPPPSPSPSPTSHWQSGYGRHRLRQDVLYGGQQGGGARSLLEASVNLGLLQPEVVDLRVPGQSGQGFPPPGVILWLVERQTLHDDCLGGLGHWLPRPVLSASQQQLESWVAVKVSGLSY